MLDVMCATGDAAHKSGKNGGSARKSRQPINGFDANLPVIMENWIFIYALGVCTDIVSLLDHARTSARRNIPDVSMCCIRICPGRRIFPTGKKLIERVTISGLSYGVPDTDWISQFSLNYTGWCSSLVLLRSRDGVAWVQVANVISGNYPFIRRHFPLEFPA